MKIDNDTISNTTHSLRRDISITITRTEGGDQDQDEPLPSLKQTQISNRPTYDLKSKNSSYMKISTANVGREKDEIEFATNWRRAFSNIHQ